jgi:hypothetical protein
LVWCARCNSQRITCSASCKVFYCDNCYNCVTAPYLLFYGDVRACVRSRVRAKFLAEPHFYMTDSRRLFELYNTPEHAFRPMFAGVFSFLHIFTLLCHLQGSYRMGSRGLLGRGGSTPLRAF